MTTAGSAFWRLCEDLEPLVMEMERETGRQFEALQVKEKFGELRIHVIMQTTPFASGSKSPRRKLIALRGLWATGNTAGR